MSYTLILAAVLGITLLLADYFALRRAHKLALALIEKLTQR